MEPAGLTVGVIGLAGLFNNAVDCFDYVQIGRKFGKNFQISLLKLDAARLQLSRWGQSLGLGKSLEGVQTLDDTTLSAEDVSQAERTLGQIQDLFADAEGISKRYQNQGWPEQNLAIHDPSADLNPIPASLHQKMRELAIKRQNQTSLKKKAKWALYEEKHFSRLIEDVTELVNSLVTLFPAAQPAQRNLCDIEVSEMDFEGSLPVLKEVAAGQDSNLEAALSRRAAAHQPTGYSYNITFSGGNNSGLQLGHNSGTINGLRWGGA